jgi:hypothetical protein
LPLPDRNREFSYEYLEGIDIDGRVLAFLWCTLVLAQRSTARAVSSLAHPGSSL